MSLLVSSVAAFFAALIAIRFLLRFVAKHSFAGFAYYRIALGALILVSWQLGWVRW
jgi:undecaprenyl-diphosphatase